MMTGESEKSLKPRGYIVSKQRELDVQGVVVKRKVLSAKGGRRNCRIE